MCVCVCLIICHSPQQLNRPGPGSVWLHTRAAVHTVMCVCICACVRMTTRIHRSVLCCGDTLWSTLITPTYKYTHILYHSNRDNSRSHGSRRGDRWELHVCRLNCWATMPWQPSLNLPSTSSPLWLCCDSHHNGCCLWTCQAAKDTKTTESTFDIRSCHQKTRDKLSWQLC